jgi:hypothetical protein
LRRKRIVQRFYVDHAEHRGPGRTELLVREYPQLKYEPREHHCTDGLLPVHIFSPLPRSQLLMANTSVRELRTMVIAGACSTCCLRSPRGEDKMRPSMRTRRSHGHMTLRRSCAIVVALARRRDTMRESSQRALVTTYWWHVIDTT